MALPGKVALCVPKRSCIALRAAACRRGVDVTLAAGTKLGPYQVLSPIGAGGMGEVYRARDSKLKHDRHRCLEVVLFSYPCSYTYL